MDQEVVQPDGGIDWSDALQSWDLGPIDTNGGPAPCLTQGDCFAYGEPAACKTWVCWQGTCEQSESLLEGFCDDGNICSTGEMCQPDGSCGGGYPLTCNDGNACTTDSCDALTGCNHVNNTAPCTDNNPCTGGDVCGNGVCFGPLNPCDDGNICTADICGYSGGGLCGHPIVDYPCEDGDPCTVHICDSGTGTCVVSIWITEPCDDGNACTTDFCDALTGCSHVNTTAPCNDNNPCTGGDVCGDGVCAGPLNPCDDGNICTVDVCQPSAPGSSCWHPTTDAPCEDGDPCTTNPCNALKGTCAPAVANSCDDGNDCTLDSCVAKTGCSHEAVPAACSDNNICTGNDACADGVCKGGSNLCDDGNVCTADSCLGYVNVKGESCSHQSVSAACDDGNACTNNVCNPSDGACVSSQVSCDDGDACTLDTCDAVTGCSNKSSTNLCSDGVVCTPNGCMWDLTKAFTFGMPNPIGAWSWGWKNSVLGTMKPMTNKQETADSLTWAEDSMLPLGDLGPRVWLTKLGNPAVGAPANTVVMHVGSGIQTVVRWTAPSACTVNAYIAFQPGSAGTTSATIVAAGVKVASTVDTDVSVKLSVSVTLLAGESVDFGVGPSTTCLSNCDTPVAIFLNTVP